MINLNTGQCRKSCCPRLKNECPQWTADTCTHIETFHWALQLELVAAFSSWLDWHCDILSTDTSSMAIILTATAAIEEPPKESGHSEHGSVQCWHIG